MGKRALAAVLGIAMLALVVWFAATQNGVPDTSAPASMPSSSDRRDSAPPTDTIPEEATRATVNHVHDGDTLFLEDDRKVRLLGVNTPEIGEDAECWGEEARTLLRELIPEGSEVWVLADVEPHDQYGRSLLFVYLADGTNVNLELLRQGAAEVEQYRPNWMLRDELHEAEAAARSAGHGLWGGC